MKYKLTSKMIQQNNDLREQLTRENKAYYEKVLVYMRTQTMFKDEKEIEEALMELLQDILSAQENGVSAENYFGKAPKESADEILANIPVKWTEGLKLAGIVFGFGNLFPILFDLANDHTISLVHLLIQFIITSIGVFLVFKILQKGVFNPSFKTTVLEYVIGTGVMASTIGILVLSQYFVPEIWTITLPREVAVGIASILAIGITWKVFTLLKKDRD